MKIFTHKNTQSIHFRAMPVSTCTFYKGFFTRYDRTEIFTSRSWNKEVGQSVEQQKFPLFDFSISI
ncbi:hypothetical protein [Flammeovirga sp. SJP92]|uniref:hypothetical protein n=1 Tax=Flammeovirga sp. SJP92 TaxID=1775430 RepID=UPI00079BE4CE|nr:hypothetical protein [Flammeovirga sp. SJP92]KXX69058.1 hypothetical protein AVL50_18050 [Flammeovirga sp. SJP92]